MPLQMLPTAMVGNLVLKKIEWIRQVMFFGIILQTFLLNFMGLSTFEPLYSYRIRCLLLSLSNFADSLYELVCLC